jgi:opacity protein-like surface antigen
MKSRTISFTAIPLVSLLLCAAAFAQTDVQGRSEVSAQFFGTFVHSTNSNGVQESTSDSGGILATYRFFFSKHHGVEANYGYSRSTTTYNLPLGQAGVRSSQHEWTGAYVFRIPMRRVTAFFEAGAGGLTFVPNDNTVGASNQTRAAFIYGGGADINLTHRLFVRAQYRGFVYNSPTFNVVANLGADRITHLAEPSVGFGLRL